MVEVARDALEGKGPQRRPQKPLDERLEGVAEAVGGGQCRLLSLALAVRKTVAGHRLGALGEGGGGASNASMAVAFVWSSHMAVTSSAGHGLVASGKTSIVWGGGGVRGQFIPQIGLQFWGLQVNFISLLRKRYLMRVGGWVVGRRGLARAPNNTPPSPKQGPARPLCGPNTEGVAVSWLHSALRTKGQC